MLNMLVACPKANNKGNSDTAIRAQCLAENFMLPVIAAKLQATRTRLVLYKLHRRTSEFKQITIFERYGINAKRNTVE